MVGFAPDIRICIENRRDPPEFGILSLKNQTDIRSLDIGFSAQDFNVYTKNLQEKNAIAQYYTMYLFTIQAIMAI